MNTFILLSYLLLICQIHTIYGSPLNNIENESNDFYLNKREIFDDSVEIPSSMTSNERILGSELNRQIQKRDTYGYDGRSPLYANRFAGANPIYATGYVPNPTPNAIYRRYIEPSAEVQHEAKANDDAPVYSKKASSAEANDEKPGLVEMLLDGVLGTDAGAESDDDVSSERRGLQNSNENSSRQQNSYSSSNSAADRRNMDSYPAGLQQRKSLFSFDNILREIASSLFPAKARRSTSRRSVMEEVYTTAFHIIDYLAATFLQRFISN